MPDVVVDKKAILDALRSELGLDWDTKIVSLRSLIGTHTFNPFTKTTDGTVQGWNNLKEANRLISEIIDHAITAAEKICTAAGAVAAGKEKLDAVVSFLDDCIKLPFYLEPFDGPMIRFAITQIIGLLNTKFGRNWVQHVPQPTGSV